MQGRSPHEVLVGHCRCIGEVEADGGVEAIYEGELAHEHVSSPSHVEAPPYLECLYRQLQSVIALLVELGKQRDDDLNEVITFMIH